MARDDVPEVITSRTNRVVKLARSLSQRRASRYESRLFFAEGTRVLRTLAESSTRIETLLIDHSRAAEIDDELLDALKSTVTRIAYIEGRLYREIATTEHPQPVSAICAMPNPSLPTTVELVVVFDGIGDPGNAGTILRTAVAFGVDLIALTPGTVDLFNPKTVRSAAGLVGRIPTIEIANVGELIERPELTNSIVAFADSHGEKTLEEVPWRAPSIVILGSEPTGTSSSSRSVADFGVRIPMAGPAESLNVAASASILLHHVSRRLDTLRK